MHKVWAEMKHRELDSNECFPIYFDLRPAAN